MKEKNDRMEELERLNKERENNLIKKMMKKEAIKEKYDKQRKEKFSMDKEKREEKMKKCRTQKIEIMRELNERRLDIIDFQLDLLKRGKKKDKSNELKRINAGERRVISQMTMEKNLTDFYKRMNALKDQSIYKKTEEEKQRKKDIKCIRHLKEKKPKGKKKNLKKNWKNNKCKLLIYYFYLLFIIILNNVFYSIYIYLNYIK